MKNTLKRRLIAMLLLFGNAVAESNGYVTMLTVSKLSAHVQYKFAKNTGKCSLQPKYS